MTNTSFNLENGIFLPFSPEATGVGIPGQFTTWSTDNKIGPAGTPSGALLDQLTGFSGTGFLNRTGSGSYIFSSIFSVANTWSASQIYSSVPFPVPSNSIDFGGPLNSWRTVYCSGIAFGVDSLNDYIVGNRSVDLNFTSAADGSMAHEINFATPLSATAGLNTVVNRFNLRAGAAQGSSVINAFESITFPFATSFPGVDNNNPGLGFASGASTAVVTGSISGSVFTVTGVTSGTIGVGNYLTNASRTIPGGIYIVSQASGPAGGTGTYNTSLSLPAVNSGTVTLTTPPYLRIQGGVNGGAYVTSGYLGVGGVPTNPFTLIGDGTLAGNAQVLLRGASNGNQQLLFGYDTVSDYGFIQPVLQGTGFKTLKLNPLGGPVSLGGTLKTLASATSAAGVNIPSGTAPTSPVDGDMWYDGTNLKFRVGGTTKTVTLT